MAEDLLGVRQIERLFLRKIGISPRGFLRLCRFGRAEARLFAAGEKEKRLGDIGADSGYYDQAHFIREFERNAFPESFREATKEAFPTGRITEPEDVASLVVYLGTAANAHVNGESVKVTGCCSFPLMTRLWENARNASA